LVGKPDPGDLAILALAPQPYQAGGRLEDELGDWLGHRDHAGLEQDGGRADGVAARHGRVLGRLRDHVAHLRVGVAGPEDEVGTVHHAAARLEQQQLADVVTVLFQVDLLIEHGLTGHVADAAGDHLADLAAGVAFHDVEYPAPAHWWLAS